LAHTLDYIEAKQRTWVARIRCNSGYSSRFR